MSLSVRNKTMKTIKKYFLAFLLVTAASTLCAQKETKSEQYERIIKEGGVKEITSMFKKGNDIQNSKIGETKDSLVMTALKYDREPAIISLLFRAGCSAKETNIKKQNALMYACLYSSNKDSINLILKKTTSKRNAKKKLLKVDAEKKSAWDYAHENKSSAALEIISEYFQEEKKETKSENEIIVIKSEPEIEEPKVLLPQTELSEPAPLPPQPESEEVSIPEPMPEPKIITEESETVLEQENKPEKEQQKEIINEPENIPASKLVDTEKYDKVYLYDFVPKEEEPEPEEDDGTQELEIVENPDEQDKDGRTALMIAAKNGNDWEIRSLIKSNAKTDIQDKDGWTALMYAVRYQNNIEVVNILLEAGANPNIKNKYGINAMQFAAGYSENPEILKKLLAVSKSTADDIFKAYIMAITTSTESTVTQISKLKVFVSYNVPQNRFYEGRTPLMYAAEFSSSTQTLKFLMDNGAATELRAPNGKTAFDYAQSNKLLKHDKIYWSLNQH